MGELHVLKVTSFASSDGILSFIVGEKKVTSLKKVP